MRRTKLVQKRHGRELPAALAEIRFEAIDNGPIHDPALRNAGVRIRRNRRQDHQGPCAEAVLESEVSGRRAGVGWSLDLMHAADHRETTPKDRRRGSPEPLSWLPFRFTMSAVASPVLRFLRDDPVDFPSLHTGQTG